MPEALSDIDTDLILSAENASHKKRTKAVIFRLTSAAALIAIVIGVALYGFQINRHLTEAEISALREEYPVFRMGSAEIDIAAPPLEIILPYIDTFVYAYTVYLPDFRNQQHRKKPAKGQTLEWKVSSCLMEGFLPPLSAGQRIVIPLLKPDEEAANTVFPSPECTM